MVRLLGLGQFGRYLAKEIYLGIAFVLFGFIALFAFFDLIAELDDVGKGSYRIPLALAHVALGLPSLAYEAIPIAVLIGAIYALASLASRSEVTVARASGWSPSDALWTVFIIGIPILLFSFVVGEWVAPRAERMANDIRVAGIGANLGKDAKSGVWIRDTEKDDQGQVVAHRFVNARSVNRDGSLADVRVFEFDAQYRLIRITKAESAVSVPKRGWELQGVHDTDFLAMTDGLDGQPQGVRSAKREPRLWVTIAGPDLVGGLAVNPSKMSIQALSAYIAHLRENRQVTEAFEIAFWRKLVYPALTWVMLVLALPFAFLHGRSGGIGFKVFMGIMLGVGFHFTNNVSSHLGLLNAWSPAVAALTPSLLVMVIAILSLAWVSRH